MAQAKSTLKQSVEPKNLSPLERSDYPSPPEGKRILYSLMVAGMIMPLMSSMFGVALPVIRDEFQIQADVTAWVATIFTLPFVILMPVYGRLSDGLGKRRLILAGIAIFSAGALIAILAQNLGWLMLGRAVQGIGLAGLIPLSLALLTAIFRPGERGRALGIWSSVGPTLAFIGPLVAGFVVALWGWRGAFGPPLIVALLALLVVYKGVPPRLTPVKPYFVRQFDWLGVFLLAGTLTSLLFYLSSRPITGIAPFADWRLLGTTLLFFTLFYWWESRRHNPFVMLEIFANKLFSRASLSASTRMFVMSGGLGFLLPLYLVDIHQLNPTQSGFMLMINPGAMMLIVRFGGQFSDRWGSRGLVLTGFGAQLLVMLSFWQLPATASLWLIGLLLALHGLGAGLMLAALHNAALGSVSPVQMGVSSGMYSMIRFLGVVIGTALGGVLLQYYLDLAVPTIVAFQNAYLLYAGFAILGLVLAFGIKEPKSN